MIHTISSINNNVSNLKDRTTILCQSKTRTKTKPKAKKTIIKKGVDYKR